MDINSIVWPTVIIVGGIVCMAFAMRQPNPMTRSTALGGAAIASLGSAFLMRALIPDGPYLTLSLVVFGAGTIFFTGAEFWMRWKARRVDSAVGPTPT